MPWLRLPIRRDEDISDGMDGTGSFPPLSKTDAAREAESSSLLQELMSSTAFDDSSYSSSTTCDGGSEQSPSASLASSGRTKRRQTAHAGGSRGQGRAKRPARASSDSSPRLKKPLLLWRKYGQKHLKGDQRGIVRCYYKCFDPTCPARRYVEKPASDLDRVLEVRHEAEHNHIVSLDFDDHAVEQNHSATAP